MWNTWSYLLQVTPVALWPTWDQKEERFSGTGPAWAAVEAHSSLLLAEEYLSAESKCSSWPSGPDVPLQTDTAGGRTDNYVHNNEPARDVMFQFLLTVFLEAWLLL